MRYFSPQRFNFRIGSRRQTLAGCVAFGLSAAVFVLSCRDNRGEVTAVRQEIESLQKQVASLRKEVDALGAIVPGGAVSDGRAMAPQSSNEAIIDGSYSPSDAFRDDPFYGPNESPILVMVFSDYQCRSCQRFLKDSFSILRAEFAERNKIRLVLRDLPLEGNEHAMTAAALAHCAGEQGEYWAMFQQLIDHPEEVQRGDFAPLIAALSSAQESDEKPKLDGARVLQCARSGRYDEELAQDAQEARALGARGAPGTFIGKRIESGSPPASVATFRGVFIRGAQPFPVLDNMLRELMK